MTFKALITEKTDDGYQSRVGDKNLEDLPEGDVLVRVAWSSLNYKDALSASGNKGVTRSFPHTPGIDAAGVVEEAGDGPFSVGDAVICTGYDLGMNTSGGYGDYIRVPAEWLAPLPAGLSARDAMVLGTAGLTAALCVEALIDTGLQPEQGEGLVFPFILRGVNLLGVDSVELPCEVKQQMWQLLASDWRPALDKLESREVTREQLPDCFTEILAGKLRGRVVVKINP
jgi:D-arabinose 1-dehydrogenase-like Zn-dependent alcohol dehydrogenase